ncbi:hypothetical protein LP52_22070 [Streptomonospora alba]|uniref:DUF4192 domain-containing protein n=1 Tax=Streptomonospora alba TaxID=183763 RepID=A0A0C2JJB5_9ACTN|nr:DUF4192 domain-containing protein [Streptomonospora alba]KIH96982.1 hypothetical protein LP52_22070 [Streptomonospora alba]
MAQNKESSPVPVQITLSGPSDILAAVPYIVGYHPRDTLVVLGLRGDTPRLHATFCRELAPADADTDCDAAADRLAAALLDEECSVALAVGYGPAAEVTRQVDAVRSAAERAGIAVREALRAADGRYWSYVCDSPGCCPPEGVPYDPSVSAVAATAVANGLRAWPNRDSLRDHLAPVGGTRRALMRAATRAAEERGARLRGSGPPRGRDAYGPRFRVEGARAVRDAVAAAERDELPEDPGRIAWLGVLLGCIRVRDEAWTLIDPERAPSHQRLWRHVLRHAEPAYRPAPGSLLAVSAWARQDTALAEAALERVHEVDPDYSMAALVHRALRTGLAWRGYPSESLQAVWPLEDP